MKETADSLEGGSCGLVMKPDTNSLTKSGAKSALGLTPFADKMLTALQRLSKEREPHPCGGYTTDDMQWRMGVAFTAQETLTDALDELEQARLIRMAGFDDEDAIGTCYELIPAKPIGRFRDQPTDAEREAVLDGFFGEMKKVREEMRAAVQVAMPALERLCEVMQQKTGQSYHVRGLLYSLYNGQETSLLEIVAVDWAIKKDLCAVLLAFSYENVISPIADGEPHGVPDFYYAAMRAAIGEAGLWDWFVEAHKEEA